MEYHIKWLGYVDPDDSWEPEEGLTRDGTVENTHPARTLTNTNKKTTCNNRNTTNKNQHDMFESSHSNLDG
jgi:hypothetical protein